MSAIVGNALDDLVGTIVAKRAAGDDGFSAAVDRQYMEMELKMLKTKIDTYKEGDLLSTSKQAELKAQLESELANQKDVFMYLNGELAKKTDEISELLTREKELIADSERRLQEAETRGIAQRHDFEVEQAKASEKIAELQRDLDRLTEFRKKKEQIEEELESRGKALAELKEFHETTVSDLERRHVMEKDRLKKEMLFKLRETKANLLKMTDNQLDTTTKRTIAENEQMSSELAWQSKETEKLIHRNDKLVGENQSLKRELSLSKQTEEQMAKKVNVYQKTIQTLLSKLSALEASKDADISIAAVQAEEGDRRRVEDMRERDMLMAQLGDADQQSASSHAEIAQLRSRLEEMESRHAEMISLQDEAVRFTFQCIEDVRDRVLPTRRRTPPTGASRPAFQEVDAEAEAMGQGGGEEEERNLATLDARQRGVVMEYIREQLVAYQEQLKELALHNAWKEHSSSMGGGTANTQMHLPPIAAAAHKGFPSASDVGEGTVTMAVGGQVRPWGQRSTSRRTSTLGR